MAISKEAQEILIDAAGLISNEDNWCKGVLIDRSWGHERVCSLGAIYKAADIQQAKQSGHLLGVNVGKWMSRPAVQQAVAALASGGLTPVFQFDSVTGKTRMDIMLTVVSNNDRSLTTHADVKGLFCKVIKANCLPTEDSDEKEVSRAPSARLSEREANRRLGATPHRYTPPPWVGKR